MTKKLTVIEKLEQDRLKKDAHDFNVGDTVRVHIRIIEGEKERVQVFQGTVIARKGKGLSETFSIHRFAYGEGMERVFILHSPRIAKIEVVKKGRVRRSKLYYLRGTSGKASKVKGAAYTAAATATSSDNNNVDNVSDLQVHAVSNHTSEAGSETAKS
jgi:large subunit ribosomal protein L19